MAASDTLTYTVTTSTATGSGTPTETADGAVGVGVFATGTTFVGSGAPVEARDVVAGPPGLYRAPAGEGTWVQLLSDVSSRLHVLYLQAPSESWAVNADGGWTTGSRWPMGVSGEHVTNEWTFETVWPVADRPLADEFVALLKSAAESADARLLVNIAAPAGGTPIQFVAEAHQIGQQFQVGSSSVSVTFARVDPS